MSLRVHTIFALLLGLATIAAGQSLSEIAKKEKERRKNNKDTGKQIRVITEVELNPETGEVTSDAPSSEEATSASPDRRRPSASPSRRGRGVGEEEDRGSGEEEGSSSAIALPRDAPLEKRINIFERLKKAYLAEVKEIDEKIAKNNARLAEIEQMLSSIGASGLPIAPQADRGTRHEGEFVSLRNEQTQLRQQNNNLETEKKTKANDLREKGRRAGVPPGYLRF